MIFSRQYSRGFTLLELIIVLAVVALLSFTTAPLGLQFYYSQNINGIRSTLGDTLARARSMSLVQQNDTSYGVALINVPATTTAYVLYQGPTYATRVASADLVTYLVSGVSLTFPGTVTEINFGKHTGTPTATGTISVSWNGLTRNLSIDNFGYLVEL